MATKFEFISAGAGSGKTHKLTDLIFEALSQGRARPSGLIATTFTVKAASELRERVRANLVDKHAFSLATEVGQSRIGTVNSVCGELLERFAFEAGLPTKHLVLDETGAATLLQEAIDTVADGPKISALWQVARRLCLHEPPRGKTEATWKTDLKRLVDLARSNAIDEATLRGLGESNAQELLSHFPAATGNHDAALLSEIDVVLPAVQAAVDASAKKNTTTYLGLLLDAKSAIPGGAYSWAEWDRLCSEKSKPEAGLKAAVAGVTELAASYATHSQFHADIREYLTLMFDIAADALDAYRLRKGQLGAVDFTDQECELLAVLDEPSVEEALRDELDMLVVDEFQDTSPIQLALFVRLASLAKEVVWVGDSKQAIYGFRGSDPLLMKAVVAAVPAQGGTVSALPNSWRSRPALVSLVNGLFGNAFPGLRPSDIHLTAVRPEQQGVPALADWILEGSNKAAHLDGISLGIKKLLVEATQVVDKATKLLRLMKLSDIAVLMRTNESVRDLAATLSKHGVPSLTAQAGLIERPEIVLALACLRRLNDDNDTLATAEIVSLADCAEPEDWLQERLTYVSHAEKAWKWREESETGSVTHPIVVAIASFRKRAAVLSPSEAVRLVIAGCGLPRRVVQWQQGADVARRRLANLEEFAQLAVTYEDECATGHSAGTLSGFLIWLGERAAKKQDNLAEPSVDAVNVLTHHRSKGLEWPVVVLCDLNGDVRDRLWDSQACSAGPVNFNSPLAGRSVRYWPWVFGARQQVPVADEIAASPLGLVMRQEAKEEATRLLYVSMTRARDTIILARPAKALSGETIELVRLDTVLPADMNTPVNAVDGTSVPFKRENFKPPEEVTLVQASGHDLAWFDHPDSVSELLPLVVPPSSAEEGAFRVLEQPAVGKRIDSGTAADRSVLGAAIHASIAADLASATPLSQSELQHILDGTGTASQIRADDLHAQLASIRGWLDTRWAGAPRYVEIPVVHVLPSGQVVSGRIDLLVRTATGWILIDHKSTPQASAQWDAVAQAHGGQMLAYRDAIQAVTGLPVEAMWLLLPVAGAALRIEPVPPPATAAAATSPA